MRGAAALKIFSDLAKQTQVLLFTHHRRSAELAITAGAQMIELGALAAPPEDSPDGQGRSSNYGHICVESKSCIIAHAAKRERKDYEENTGHSQKES
jgi:hypothetical protein